MPPYREGQVFKDGTDDQPHDPPALAVDPAAAPGPALLSRLGREARTAFVSCLATLAITIPTMIYTAGARSEADRQAVRRIADQVATDHETQSKLAASVQSLSESVLLLTSKVSQMVPVAVHEARWNDIDHQIKALDDKINQQSVDIRETRRDIKEVLQNVKR